METRIKVVTDANGSVRYYPQVKTLFFWRNILEFKVYDFLPAKRLSLEDAKKVVDSYIVDFNKLIIEKTEYVKYP